jgi:hypothetical protein
LEKLMDVAKRFQAALPEGWEYDSRESALLVLGQRVADRIDQLELLLAEQGLVVQGSTGQPRLSPLVSEIRLQQLALARILEGVRVPNEIEAPAKSARHQKAANRRWDRQREGQN